VTVQIRAGLLAKNGKNGALYGATTFAAPSNYGVVFTVTP
jgi:hypothetical protein